MRTIIIAMSDHLLQTWAIHGGGRPASLSLAAGTLDEVSRGLPQGFYSTFRTFGGGTRALDLKHHLVRLYGPAAGLDIHPTADEPGLRAALRTLLEAYRSGEARVRISLSTSEQPGQVFVAIEPLKLLPGEVYRQGVQVVTAHVQRSDPQLKSTAFIGQSQAERQVVQRSGAFEGLIVRNGRILEGLTSNFYYVKDGLFGTARTGILPGVTRRLVLRLAREAGLGTRYSALRISEISDISEAMISSSSRGIVPVVAIDGQPVGAGCVGSVAQLLMTRYGEFVAHHTEPI